MSPLFKKSTRKNESKTQPSEQSEQPSSPVEDPPKLDSSGYLIVKPEKPLRYKCEIRLFNAARDDPKEGLVDLDITEPLGSVEIEYISDTVLYKKNRTIKLHLDPACRGAVFFEDGFHDITWSLYLMIRLRFNVGTVVYCSKEGMRRNESVQYWTIEIKDKPDGCLGGKYPFFTDHLLPSY